MEQSSDNFRIESEVEVNTYLQMMKYALNHGASLHFQIDRRVDDSKEERFTNRFTVASLFPDEAPEPALRRELQNLTAEQYFRTVRDIRFPNRSEMREFGTVYPNVGDIYIKVRVELLDPNNGGGHTVFVMSFHFAERPFDTTMFPYRKQEGGQSC